MKCILCWLRGAGTQDAQYVVNGMSVCSMPTHLRAATECRDPHLASQHIHDILAEGNPGESR